MVGQTTTTNQNSERNNPVDPVISSDHLKKQSQFSEAHISVKSLEKGEYDNSPTNGTGENKANLDQFQRDLQHVKRLRG